MMMINIVIVIRIILMKSMNVNADVKIYNVKVVIANVVVWMKNHIYQINIF